MCDKFNRTVDKIQSKKDHTFVHTHTKLQNRNNNERTKFE